MTMDFDVALIAFSAKSDPPSVEKINKAGRGFVSAPLLAKMIVPWHVPCAVSEIRVRGMRY